MNTLDLSPEGDNQGATEAIQKQLAIGNAIINFLKQTSGNEEMSALRGLIGCNMPYIQRDHSASYPSEDLRYFLDYKHTEKHKKMGYKRMYTRKQQEIVRKAILTTLENINLFQNIPGESATLLLSVMPLETVFKIPTDIVLQSNEETIRYLLSKLGSFSAEVEDTDYTPADLERIPKKAVNEQKRLQKKALEKILEIAESEKVSDYVFGHSVSSLYRAKDKSHLTKLLNTPERREKAIRVLRHKGGKQQVFTETPDTTEFTRQMLEFIDTLPDPV